MNPRVRVGDIFEVKIGTSSTVRFFQYIAVDKTQLSSQVVRVFRERYKAGASLDPDSIARGKIEFHAHVFLRIGLKQKVWSKVGHAEPPPDIKEVKFRDSRDYGHRPGIRVSKNWRVWKINEPFEDVGELPPGDQRADIGVVVPPESLVYRMHHGKYDFGYPAPN